MLFDKLIAMNVCNFVHIIEFQLTRIPASSVLMILLILQFGKASANNPVRLLNGAFERAAGKGGNLINGWNKFAENEKRVETLSEYKREFYFS